MSKSASVPCTELILGGQKSGKSRRAEALAQQWLGLSNSHRAVLIATGLASDAEMQARIARHRSDRAARAPGLETVEEPRAVAQAIARLSNPQTLLVVDCLTLWLSHWSGPQPDAVRQAPVQVLVDAVAQASGPVVLVSNEIGMGVIPMGEEVRAYVDVLGLLHQALAQVCPRVTLMVAGHPLWVKGAP